MNLPGLADGRVHDRHAQVILQHFYDAYRLPTAALDVDAIGIRMFTMQALDMRVQRLDRNLRDLVERDVDRLHR